MKKIIIFLLLIPSIVFASVPNLQNVSKEVNSLASKAKSAILIEASTGEILFEKNSHEKLAPASMTKIMSMLIVMEAIENKIINWDDVITISENASSMGGSQILLETNEQMSVKDLFKGVAVASGNDAIVALAEATYGTVDEFVIAMNKKAKQLGLKDTNFKNPHGLDIENHYSSAYDMSIIAKELLKHKKVLEFTSIYEDYLRKGTDREYWLVNTNKLVKFYNGADGLKTGYTESAGYCLTATAKKDNVRLIAVVMGEESSNERNNEVRAMLDYGFSKVTVYNIASKNKKIKKINIDKSSKDNNYVVPVDDVIIVKKKGEKLGKITYDLKLKELTAPIKKGTIVGKLNILENNKLLSTVDLTINENVKKSKFIDLYLNYIIDLLTGKIFFK